MSKHLSYELDSLKKKLLELSAVVESGVDKAVRSVSQKDLVLAEEVIAMDPKIDLREVEVEEDCLKILALYQPVAVDLRLIVSVLKINNDLERIGDLSVNIARRASYLSESDEIEVPFDFENMALITRGMLKDALRSLIDHNSKVAEEVCRTDNEVDAIHKEMYQRVSDGVQKEPQNVDAYIQYLSISRNLERIADYATNIAEDVIYLIEGKIVRHSG